MKSTITKITLLFFLALGSFPQVYGQLSVGGGLSYGTDIEKIGFQGRAEFDVTDQISVAPYFIFFLRENVDVLGIEASTGLFTINVDGHFNIEAGNAIVYPLLGLNIAIVSAKVDIPGVGNESESASEIGLNVGGGAKFEISELLDGFAEIKYVLGDANQLVISAGVLVPIGG